MPTDHSPLPSTLNPARPTVPATPANLLTHQTLVGTRLFMHAGVRFAVSLAIILGTFVAPGLVGIEGLPTTELRLLAVVIAAYNLAVLPLIWPHRGQPTEPRTVRRLHIILYVTMVLDFLALSIAIWLVGGSRSPFLSFYLFHVIVACLLLPRAAAFASLGLACSLLIGLVLGEHIGLIPVHAPDGAVAGGDVHLDLRYVATVLTVNMLLFVLTALLLTGFMALLRRSESELQEANAQLAHVSDLRRDFLHVALHNLQSPAAAASMLLRIVASGMLGGLEPRQQTQLERALTRLDDLSTFLANMRTLASLESGRLADHAEPIDVVEMLRSIQADHLDLADARSHQLQLEVLSLACTVLGVPRLIREAIVNYVTNAIKYTPTGGSIVIGCRRQEGMVRIEVRDTGIGIAPEDQARLFGEFVRLEKRHAPLGRVEGTGLGLSIVKRIIEAHGGRVGVESTVGAGSTFFAELPALPTFAGRSQPATNPGAEAISERETSPAVDLARHGGSGEDAGTAR